MSKVDQEYLRRARVQMQETTNFLIVCHDDPAWLRHVIQIAQKRLQELQQRDDQ
jgi:hypothetical protein